MSDAKIIPIDRSARNPGAEERAKFLDDRQTGVGGSDASTYAGLEGTKLSLWMKKVGLLEPLPDTEWFYWGRRLEATVLAEYAIRRGVPVLGRIAHPTGKYPTRPVIFRPDGDIDSPPSDYDHAIETLVGCLRHPIADPMIGHVDGWTLDPEKLKRGELDIVRLVDAKTSAFPKGFGPDGSDEVPERIVCQVQHYAHLTIPYKGGTLEGVDVAALVRGNDFRIYPLPADVAFGESLQERATAFWRYVEAGEPPPPQTEDEKLLAKAVPEDDGKTYIVEWGTELHQAIERLREATNLVAEAERIRDGAKVAVKWKMGKSAKLVGLGNTGPFTVSWKQTRSGTRPFRATFSKGEEE